MYRRERALRRRIRYVGAVACRVPTNEARPRGQSYTVGQRAQPPALRNKDAMIDLLVAGYLGFTVPLLLVAVAALGVAVRTAAHIASARPEATAGLQTLFHLGLFAFVFGLTSQGISLYQMMGAIETAGGVSPAIVAGGLKVSFIAPLFGLYIFVAALLLRLVLATWLKRAVPAE